MTTGGRLKNQLVGIRGTSTITTWLFGGIFAVFSLTNILLTTRILGNTLNALLTIFIPVIIATILLLNTKFKLPRISWPYLAFIIYAMMSLYWSSSGEIGIQNILVFTGSFLLYIYFYNAQINPCDKRFGWLWRILVLVLISIDAIGYITGEFITYPRQQSLFILILLPLVLMRYKQHKNILDLLALGYLVLYPILTGSRIVSLAVFVMTYFVFLSDRKLNTRKIAFHAMIAMIAFSLIVFLANIFDFRTQDIQGLEWYQSETINILGFEVYTTGRLSLWIYTYDNILMNPIWGYGAGMSSYFIEQFNANGHPLNEYLRVAHDYGLIGFILFFSSIYVIVKRLSTLVSISPVVYAATITLYGLLISMLTDNSIIYTFVMFPLYSVLGVASRHAELASFSTQK